MVHFLLKKSFEFDVNVESPYFYQDKDTFTFYLQLYECYMSHFDSNDFSTNVWHWRRPEVEYPSPRNLDTLDLSDFLSLSMLNHAMTGVYMLYKYTSRALQPKWPRVNMKYEEPRIPHYRQEKREQFFCGWFNEENGRQVSFYCQSYISRFHGLCIDINWPSSAQSVENELHINYMLILFWMRNYQNDILDKVPCPEAEAHMMQTHFSTFNCSLYFDDQVAESG